MYAYIKGTVEFITADSVVIDNQGIGYRIFVPGKVGGSIRVGDNVKLFTHFSVREDAMQLYGFLNRDDLELFRLLIGVSGIGPKGAVAVLSVLTADELRFAILSDDAAAIAKAPGVGKKTAQKVIIELKDKLDLADAFEKKAENTEGNASAASGNVENEAVQALQALGYTASEAYKAVKKASSTQELSDVEGMIKAALREFL